MKAGVFVYVMIAIACNNAKEPDMNNGASTDSPGTKPVTTGIERSTDDTLFKSNDTLVIKNRQGNGDTLVQFHSKIWDRKYYVAEKFDGKPTRLNFAYSGSGKRFKTVTENTVKNSGANFAGHYTLAQWGCGTTCWQSAVVDLKTGNVYPGLTSCYGFIFDVTSNVIQINPPDRDTSSWYDIHRICESPEEYVWDGKSFRKLK